MPYVPYAAVRYFYAFDLVHYNAGFRTQLGRLELGIQRLKFEFTMAFGERYLKDS